MAAQIPPAPVNPTAQLAHTMPGYDVSPAIAAQEQSLQEFLNLPVKEILARLGLSPPPQANPDDGERRPEEPPLEPEAPQASPMDPSALISPVTDALGTLGSGFFEGADPLAMLQGISQVFQSTGGTLGQSLGAVDDSWKGAASTAAAAKTATAVADGARVAEQSEALRSSLATASAEVAQARVRIIAIITEFQATMAAIGPNIIFPWGWAAAIAAANKAIASTAEVIAELQSSLGTQAAAVTAAGAPVGVTAAPTGGGAPLASMISPLMSMATKGAQAGVQAGVGAAGQAASQAAAESAVKADEPAGGAAAVMAPAGSKGGGGLGGGYGGSPAVRSLAPSPMVQPETSPTQSATVRAAGVANTGGGGMVGAPYAPMAGAGQGANSSNTHTPAPFLHTTDKGGEIVGDLGTSAPPVLGAPDPNEPPDVELRI
ncbi:hypothetical protein H7J88_26750 [Mycolicibacterium flavescens]|uniref:Uncharacterized protein n=1 Tax=Mycolicibacterium flavescens TaxID=1776 RepID=A0A1E3RPQ2_MYCFV|nr:hypothetical protein [Mycolicibacterium flavescens]MCV7283241.1 hypothetical protein [Mycolicibacterium flavescens]ODQ91839.1 hypothetical protein BHQ18_02975 [Mycolicibacterium flavescens]